MPDDSNAVKPNTAVQNPARQAIYIHVFLLCIVVVFLA